MSSEKDKGTVEVSLDVAVDIAKAVVHTERAYRAAVDVAGRLRVTLRRSGRLTIEAWLNAVGVKALHTPSSVSYYCALAERRAMDALLAGADSVAIAVSGLSTMGGRLTKLELPISDFDWQLAAPDQM